MSSLAASARRALSSLPDEAVSNLVGYKRQHLSGNLVRPLKGQESRMWGSELPSLLILIAHQL